MFCQKHSQLEKRGVIARLECHNLAKAPNCLAPLFRLNQRLGEILVVIHSVRPQRNRLADERLSLAELPALKIDDTQELNRIRTARSVGNRLAIECLRLVELPRLVKFERRLKNALRHLRRRIPAEAV